MENLLNGKNLDDIEFQPTTATAKSEEFHFGPNAAPFTPGKTLDQSEAALSTKAVFGDESSASYMEQINTSHFESTFADTDISTIPEFHPKSPDPMSTSFYQDREDDNNPFDLNKVQVLPDNLEEFLNKSDTSFNETISDLPQHSPLAGMPQEDLEKVTQVTDLDKPAPSEEPVRTADLLGDFQAKSPVGESDSSFEHIEAAKSPFEIIPEVCQRPESKSSEVAEDVCVRPQSQGSEVFGLEPETAPLPADVCLKPDSVCSRPESKSPEPTENVCLRPESKSPQADSPMPALEPAENVCVRAQPESPSPVPEPADVCLRPESKSPLPENESSAPEIKSPLPQSPSPAPESIEDLCLKPESKSPQPEPQFSMPDVCLRPESKSPAPEAPSPAPSDEICLPSAKSPEPEAPTPEPQGDICQRPDLITPEPASPHSPVERLAKEEISEEAVTSPLEEITSSVKDEVASPVLSPVPGEAVGLPAVESVDEKEVDSGVDSNESVPQTNFGQEVSNVVAPEAAANVEEAPPGPDFNSTPKSFISESVDAESVVTADVNSMLEKCNLPEIASPLSGGEQPNEGKSRKNLFSRYAIKLCIKQSYQQCGRKPIIRNKKIM